MPHEITRFLRAVGSRCWFIEPRRADEIIAVLALRSRGLTSGMAAQDRAPVAENRGKIAVIRLHGVIMPRADMVDEMSGPGGAALDRFRAAFRRAAADPDVAAIVLDIDSPGGDVSLVPETAAEIRAARREGRPIVAVANNMAASAAYWIATAADQLVVTPSGLVGSIGVYMLHEDMSARLEAEGIRPTFIFEGVRKVEGNPFAPLDDVAKAALQREVAHFYDMFTRDVAKARGVPLATVRADPESAEANFGGGRLVVPKDAVRLGMADRVATIEETIEGVLRPATGKRRASIERRRLALG
jgi:signal peptide peptidase SppA